MKLGQKIKEIQTDLKCLTLSKTYQRFFNDNNKKEEKQKTIINNLYEEITDLIEKNKYNPESFKSQNDYLKKSMTSFLNIYENSYENLFRILYDKNNIIDSILSKKQDNIQKDLTECLNNLNKFISSNKKQINDSFHFLSVYTRNFYLKKFENIVSKIEEKHKNNMQENEEKKIKEKSPKNKSGVKLGKNNSSKFFNVQKVNNANNLYDQNDINKKDNTNTNVNIIYNINNNEINNILKNNINNIYNTNLIDFTEYNRDAPPPGNINNPGNKNVNQLIQNFDTLFNLRKSVEKRESDINNNLKSDKSNKFFFNENEKVEKNNIMNNPNESDIYGENEKFDADSYNNIPAFTPYFNSEFSAGSDNNS